MTNRILDHPLAAEVVAEVHGAELRVDHLLQVGVLPGETLAQQTLAPVRIPLRREELQHRLAVRQHRVRADAVARQRVDKGEHRRDEVSQRIRGRQPVGAVVHSLHLPRERDEHLLRSLVRRNLLRVVVSNRAAALDQRIEPGILRVGKLHEALEGRLPSQRIGPEAPHIGL